jgi:glycosyltransferase involved in cell wall biosynthesis
LVHTLRNDRTDILQTWLYHADLLGWAAAGLGGVQCLVWNIRASDIDTSRYKPLSGLVIRACARLSDRPQAIVVNSLAGQVVHTRLGYHPRRWVHIPNGVDVDRYQPDTDARRAVRAELGLPVDAILIGMNARYDPMKNHSGFILAAGQLVRSGLDVHFLLAGQDVDPENSVLMELIGRENLAGRVHLLGRCEDIPRLDSALDVLAMTSSFGEGFPNAVAEAMACGIPCAVTDVGDAAFLVGNTGMVVPRDTPGDMATAWGRLVKIGELERQRLGAAARRRVLENFSLSKAVASYEELYSGLIDIDRIKV